MKRETLKSKWFEGHGVMYYESDISSLRQRLEFLQDELNALRDKDFHQDAYVGELHDWIKSDSVLKALHYMDKNQHHFALTDVEYMHLYLLCLELRKADKEYNESRQDSFDQQLP